MRAVPGRLSSAGQGHQLGAEPILAVDPLPVAQRVGLGRSGDGVGVGVAAPELPANPPVLLGDHPQPQRSVGGIHPGAVAALAPTEHRLVAHGGPRLCGGFGQHGRQPRQVAVVGAKVQLRRHARHAKRVGSAVAVHGPTRIRVARDRVARRAAARRAVGLTCWPAVRIVGTSAARRRNGPAIPRESGGVADELIVQGKAQPLPLEDDHSQ